MYMPGDCWFYVTVYMFNIKKKKYNGKTKKALWLWNHQKVRIPISDIAICLKG